MDWKESIEYAAKMTDAMPADAQIHDFVRTFMTAVSLWADAEPADEELLDCIEELNSLSNKSWQLIQKYIKDKIKHEKAKNHSN